MGFDYQYEDMEAMDTKTLSEIVENIWSLGFEETATALQILKHRIPLKALEYGIDILLNDKGDDYLQAIAWDYFFWDNKEKILEAVSKRKAKIGKALLNDIVDDLIRANSLVEVSNEMINRISETYDSFSEEEKSFMKSFMRCDINGFLNIYKKKAIVQRIDLR